MLLQKTFLQKTCTQLLSQKFFPVAIVIAACDIRILGASITICKLLKNFTNRRNYSSSAMENKNHQFRNDSNIATNNLTVIGEHSITEPIKAKFKTRIGQNYYHYSQFVGDCSTQKLLRERSSGNEREFECPDRRSFYNNLEEADVENFEDTERLQCIFSFGGGVVGTIKDVDINKESYALEAKDRIAPPSKKAKTDREFSSAQEHSSIPAPKCLSQIQKQAEKEFQVIKQQMTKKKADMIVLQPSKDKRFAALDLYWLEVKPALKELYTSFNPKNLFHIYYSAVFDPNNRPVISYTKLFICYVLARYNLLIKQIKDREKLSAKRKDSILYQGLCSMDILTKDEHWKFSLQGSRLSPFVTFVEHERFNQYSKSPSSNCILFCDAPHAGPTHTMNYLLENPHEVPQILQNIPLVTIKSDLLDSINTSEIAVELSYQAYKRWSEHKDAMKATSFSEPRLWNPEPTFPMYPIAKTSSKISQLNSTKASIANNELSSRQFMKPQNSLSSSSTQAIEGQLKSKEASSIQSIEKELEGKVEFIGNSSLLQTKSMSNVLPPAPNPPKQHMVLSKIAESPSALSVIAPVQQTKIQAMWENQPSATVLPSNPLSLTEGKMCGMAENVNLTVPTLPRSLMPISIPIGSFPGQPILLVPSTLQPMLLSRTKQADNNRSK